MATYRFLLWDLLTNTPKAEIPFEGVRYGYILNDSGNFSANISVRHPKATQDNLDEGKTAIYVERNGEIVWGGVLWQTMVNSGTEFSTCVCTGRELFSLFQDIGNRGRYVRHTLEYTNLDQLAIAQNLIIYAQDTTLHGASADYDIVTNGETSGVLRSRTYYSWERANIGKAIENLAALENGFDFYIRCRWNGTTISRDFICAYPGVPSANANIAYEWKKNILRYTIPTDALSMAKKVDAIGAGEGDTMLIATAEDGMLTTYPMREADFAYKDVSDIQTLQAHANADLVRNRLPDTVPTLVVKLDDDVPVGSVIPGMNASVKIDDGKVQIDDVYKIVQMEVRVDAEGQEEMTVRFNTYEEATA
jgi:hypothetical protein